MHAKTLIGNSFQRTKNCAQNGQHRWTVYCYKLITSLSLATNGLGYNL